MTYYWRLVYGCLLSVLFGMIVPTEQRYLDMASNNTPLRQIDGEVVRMDPSTRTLLDILLRPRERIQETNDFRQEIRKRQRQCYWSAISCF